MYFSKWLAEWEGNTFNQASSYVNQSPPFPRSKYVTKSGDSEDVGQEDKAKKFGFRKNDPLLQDPREMKKMK